MAEDSGQEFNESFVSLRSLPQATLQAIYHAVTGKTETLFKRLRKNVVIDFSDFEQLYLRITQQIEHYEMLANPTVTVVVRQANHQTIQYSSWERFNSFQTNSAEITSEVTLKIEFIMRLPNVATPQRCIVNVTLDSGLPIIGDREESEFEFSDGFFISFSKNFPTVVISIQFVDFIVATNIESTIEKWFSTLQPIKNPRAALNLLDRMETINAVINQFGRIGIATFLASYVFFNHGTIGTFGHLIYAVAIAFVIWSAVAVLSTYVNRKTHRSVFRSVLPSIIIFTEGDKRAYNIVVAKISSSARTIANIFYASFVSVAVNILSSYFYSWLQH